jgi:hypothetical protein
MRRTFTLALLPLLVAAGILASAGAASADTDTSKATRSATHAAWTAEQTANRKCGYPATMAEALERGGKWERCVARQYKRLTGDRLEQTGVQCRKGACGVTSADAYLSLPTRGEYGATKVRTLTSDRMADLGIRTSAYGHLRCRVYTLPTEDHIRCTNGLVLKP